MDPIGSRRYGLNVFVGGEDVGYPCFCQFLANIFVPFLQGEGSVLPLSLLAAPNAASPVNLIFLDPVLEDRHVILAPGNPV